jgi:hypothetical protein
MTSARQKWVRPGVVALAVVLVMVMLAGSWLYWSNRQEGQGLSISADDPQGLRAPWPTVSPATGAKPEGPPFITSVSPNGRYFLDQYGKPLLVKGDSPWALMTKVLPDQVDVWFANRQKHDVNAAIVSLIGATGNGGPKDDGSTVDGLRPFVDGNILNWQEPYWQRVTDYLRRAADHGITLLVYPIDGWTIGHSFVPGSIQDCREYGGKLAARFRDLPNVVWMSGGDYFPATENLAQGSDVDHCIDAALRGLRAAGDTHLFSMQLGYQKSISTDNPYWASRVDWNFVYTYYPTYRAVLEAYKRRPVIPAIMSEANYEGENNVENSPPTTDETLRRQVLWSLTSGAAGDFMGSDDWEFHDGWQQRLDTTAVTQIQRLRKLFSDLPWWELVPDTKNELVTAGRGTEVTSDRSIDVLESDFVTAARIPNGQLAVIYLPASGTISVNPAAMAPGTRATWVDPTSGATRSAPMATKFTAPGVNAGGDQDWLLLLRS